MGITKEQLGNTIEQVKTYVDSKVNEGGPTYTDEEINTMIDEILNPPETTEGE